MTRSQRIVRVLAAIALTAYVRADVVLEPWEPPRGWTETRGGDGGEIVRVTTLAASGPGSLAEALAGKGRRIVEFTVAGRIDLEGRVLRVLNPWVTIAGETAPSPGITLVNGGLGIRTHDVIVRHVRIRPGSGPESATGGWEVDGLSVSGARDVIVDQCSLQWATDENLSATGPRFGGETPDDWRRNTSNRITFSRCLVGEGLNDSGHSKGPHSKGSLIHDNTTEIALIGNLYISNVDRNPLFKGGVRAVMVNNVVHNPGERVVQFGQVESQWGGHEIQRAALVVVGNVVRKGPDSAPEMALFEVWPNGGDAAVHLRDNLFLEQDGTPSELLIGTRDTTRVRPGVENLRTGGSGFEFRMTSERLAPGVHLVDRPPVWPPRLEALPVAEVQEWVLANVGARPWDRDATDRRMVEEVRRGGGRLVDREPEDK